MNNIVDLIYLPQYMTHFFLCCNSSDVLENLAWASVQINCLCLTNDSINFPSVMSVTKDEKFLGNSETSFAPCLTDNGHVVLSTKPKILFCDVGLSPGESKSCKY